MGISVFMFCPACWMFVPLGHRDPMLECDVDGEENWGEGTFSASCRAVLDVFLVQAEFFSPSNAYEVALGELVKKFVAAHADHEQDRKVYFANNYGIYMWEPGTEWQQSEWWRFEELVVMMDEQELPNQVASHVWTYLPSHIVKHAGYTSFDEALNYLICQRRPANSLAQARSLPYFRVFYQGILQWRADPVAGGKSLPVRSSRLSSLVEHCLKALSTAKPEQLAPLNAIQMPDNLAQKIWEALSRCDPIESERLSESGDACFEDEANKRYRALNDMFARSLDQLVITPAVLAVFDYQLALNGHIMRMIARPDCVLREVEITLADNDWEEDYSSGCWKESTYCSPGALRTLTMALLRCLQPRVERLSLTACGALTDEFLLPLDAPLNGPFVSESLGEPDSKTGGLRQMTFEDEEQELARSLMNRLIESADGKLRGPYELVELNVSNCHRLTDQITLHLHEMFPKLARLHLNDLSFLPFHSSMPPAAAVTLPPRLEHLVELNMASSYYAHEQKRDTAYFDRLAGMCPLLERLNVAFWDITDSELDQITLGFPHLVQLNLIGSGAGLTNGGLEALGRRLVSRDRHMEQVNVGSCVGLTSLSGLERVRCIKAVGARLGSLPLFPTATAPAAAASIEEEVAAVEKEQSIMMIHVEELDLTSVSDLTDECFLQVMSAAKKCLKRITINGCFRLHHATVVQAVKDFPHVDLVTGGTYQGAWQ